MACCDCRAKAFGDRTVTRDEHTLSVLVLFFEAALQQENVPGVPCSSGRGCKSRLQVNGISV